MSTEINALSDFIRDELAYQGDIPPDADLLEEQILDSFSIVQIALFIQDHFGVELEEEDLQRDHLSSLNNMLALIASKREKICERPLWSCNDLIVPVCCVFSDLLYCV